MRAMSKLDRKFHFFGEDEVYVTEGIGPAKM